ncbi:MAG: ATP-binding protein [Candidatus Sericytochromatia bacterium]|nr:ATP-binding protein [Candidatus Sericytochromatia bacterium]
MKFDQNHNLTARVYHHAPSRQGPCAAGAEAHAAAGAPGGQPEPPGLAGCRLVPVLRDLPTAAAAFDRTLRYLAVSDRWRQDYGLEDEVLEGCSHLTGLPHNRPGWGAGCHTALGGRTVRREEEPFRRADGRVLYLNWTVSPWWEREGVIGGVVIHSEDVTPWRDLQLRRAAQRERRAELRGRQALERLHGQFVDAVTHELRTPLATIVGCAELLEDGIGASLDAVGSWQVSEIQGAARRLEVLLDDLIDFTRMEAGTFRLDRQPIALRHLVAEVLAGFAHQAGECGVRLAPPAGADALLVEADHRRLRQVLGHLVHNALKFSPRGSVVRLTLWGEADEVCCEVTDAGEGITLARQARMFERFTQLEGGLRQGKGLGLGLYVCRTLVEAHGGRLGVNSRPGEGATFWLRLPRLASG